MHTPNRRGYTTIAARLIPDLIKKKLVYLLQQREPDDVFETEALRVGLGVVGPQPVKG